MLTLTRKVGEKIRIGEGIQIIVREIRKNQVRIGIVAPEDVKIFREEVYENIQKEGDDLDTADDAAPEPDHAPEVDLPASPDAGTEGNG